MNTKKALGRGLAELIPELEKEVPLFETTQEVLKVSFLPIEKIKLSSFQVRKDYKEDQSFQELLLSIKERGVLQPILVRPVEKETYECVAGERRLRACLKLGFKKIPAIIKKLSDEEVLLVALAENLQRKNLSPIEEAMAYQVLVEKFGYTQEAVAEKVGKDRSTVANLIRLLKLPSLIQKDILEGNLTVGHAKILLSLNSEKDQLALRNLILKKNLSVRETENYAKSLLSKKKSSAINKSFDKNNEIKRKIKVLIQELSSKIETEVKVKTRAQRIYLIFEFKDLRWVESFIENLKFSLTK